MTFRLSLLTLLLTVSLASAGDWPQFRGPSSAGVSEETHLATKWSPKENIRWKSTVPGRSVASPVVADGRAYVASASGAQGEQLHVVCFACDDGRILWQRQLKATGNTGCHPKTSMAAPTPVATADGVYVLFATADLVAFDKDGNLRWYRSLASDYPKIANQVGMASSPILWKETLLLPMDSGGESFLAGLDAKTGINRWKVERPKDINWVTPALRKVGDSAEVLFVSRFGLSAYDVQDGHKRWTYTTEGSTIPTPVLMGDQILLTVRGLICLQPKGDSTPEVVWTSQKLASSSCTPLVYKERIYNITGAGVLVCADLKGKEQWTERLKKGKYWASPIAADDKIFVCNDEGVCTVLQPGGDHAEILATNDLGEEIMGTPAIANGALFIQTVKSLYCIGLKK